MASRAPFDAALLRALRQQGAKGQQGLAKDAGLAVSLQLQLELTGVVDPAVHRHIVTRLGPGSDQARSRISPSA
jgi:hypothetical protein